VAKVANGALTLDFKTAAAGAAQAVGLGGGDEDEGAELGNMASARAGNTLMEREMRLMEAMMARQSGMQGGGSFLGGLRA